MKEQKYIERDITPHLQRVMSLFPVVTVCGPRQAGKTTLIRHLYPEYEYVNLENTQTRQDFYNDPQYFVRLHKSPGQTHLSSVIQKGNSSFLEFALNLY